jgi:hypothetical protein
MDAMLETNRSRVRNLTGLEIWLFIVGRALMAFGLGVLTTACFPAFASYAMWPSIGIGFVLLLLASRGLFRKKGN